MRTIINLTGSDITMRDDDGTTHTYPAADAKAESVTRELHVEPVNGVPRIKAVLNVIGLPRTDYVTMYLVNADVLGFAASTGRETKDLLSPCNAVKGEDGETVYTAFTSL